MRQLDETDLEIVRLLIEDARRPYREIADRVGLSPPAVSDRVNRLEDQGIVRRFTLDVDRTKLHERGPVLLHLEADPGAVDRVYETALDLDGVEHVSQQLDGTVVVHANAPERDVHDWFAEGFDLDAIRSYDLSPVVRSERSLGIDVADFALSCAVCENSVSEGGVTASFGGEVKAFCCPSCESSYRERYERHREEAN